MRSPPLPLPLAAAATSKPRACGLPEAAALEVLLLLPPAALEALAATVLTGFEPPKESTVFCAVVELPAEAVTATDGVPVSVLDHAPDDPAALMPVAEVAAGAEGFSFVQVDEKETTAFGRSTLAKSKASNLCNRCSKGPGLRLCEGHRTRSFSAMKEMNSSASGQLTMGHTSSVIAGGSVTFWSTAARRSSSSSLKSSTARSAVALQMAS
mmetsp:Transcript_61820/g.109771  ORF Transcript_61820/g.109771 Transcript_61820/m.109771 type:complete len:211 (-) Transcript_61820:619-1251(-)